MARLQPDAFDNYLDSYPGIFLRIPRGKYCLYLPSQQFPLNHVRPIVLRSPEGLLLREA
jgi:hypothetical protein